MLIPSMLFMKRSVNLSGSIANEENPIRRNQRELFFSLHTKDLQELCELVKSTLHSHEHTKNLIKKLSAELDTGYFSSQIASFQQIDSFIKVIMASAHRPRGSKDLEFQTIKETNSIIENCIQCTKIADLNHLDFIKLFTEVKSNINKEFNLKCFDTKIIELCSNGLSIAGLYKSRIPHITEFIDNNFARLFESIKLNKSEAEALKTVFQKASQQEIINSHISEVDFSVAGTSPPESHYKATLGDV